MHKKNSKNFHTAGFTLIEILVSIGIVAILSTVALSMFYGTIASYEKSNSLLELQANGERILSVLSREIRSARAVVGYDDSQNCTQNCPSPYLIVQSQENPSICLYYGLVSTGVGEPDLWSSNGYIFREEISCPADPSIYDGSPGSGAEALSNRNPTDPRNGINAVSLSFLVSAPTDRKASVQMSLELRQGVTGTASLPPAQSRVSVTLESSTSLR